MKWDDIHIHDTSSNRFSGFFYSGVPQDDPLKKFYTLSYVLHTIDHM